MCRLASVVSEVNTSKQLNRQRRHRRVRARIVGTKERPRVSVFKSNKHIFVQLIDDESRKTILSSKVVSAGKSKIKGNKSEKATEVGKIIAEKAKTAGINEVVFDRGGYKYHGRVKALADGLRAGGLKF
ncbi:MAG: 50S ribosomal protein L18 [Candidatus Taylorbacteria bacterium]|nr:50S ribosomal protein L18 [Candidatus Taylorbacteria bacterium]